ncbi:hypothetical protein V5799_005225 [Amblyomma americanum]|uniref:Chitin-binding type-2 domain-containing protein n=1 Tax=Amblyomma americanum TaxID=6943 RepID=A0AAQ4DZV5_AMBAM
MSGSQAEPSHPASSLGSAMMKLYILLALLAATEAAKVHARTRRAAYELPDGVEFVVGGVQTTFQCERGGYFADVSNNCQLFHICNEIYKEDGSVELQQYTFFCGNQTVFNQLSLTCAHPEESVPCSNAPDFFYINDNIGRVGTQAHTEDDLQRAAPLVPGFQQQQQFAASNKHETRLLPPPK